MKLRIDLNADLGEGAGHDEELLGVITSASISCGAHAGTPADIGATLKAARLRGVAVGAHPGFPDRAHFGRRELNMPPDALTASLAAQLRDFAQWALEASVRVRHVKPHGALYNMAARDPVLARLIAEAVRTHDPHLALYAPAGSALAQAGVRATLPVVREFFADRHYLADGTLVPRSSPQAHLPSANAAAERAMRALEEKSIRSVDGIRINMEFDSICLHGDHPDAVAFGQELVCRLRAADIRVVAVT